MNTVRVATLGTCVGDRDRAPAGVSVLAWLDAVGNVAEAVTRLGVHVCTPTTCATGCGRTAELFDISLDDPDDRLSLWLHLRLMHREPPVGGVGDSAQP